MKFNLKAIGAHRTFASLKYRNFRLWFWGQMVSLFGTWMQLTAEGFLVYELTKSPGYLGLMGFVAGIPAWIFTLYAGVVSDRVHRRTIMLFTQLAMMILAFVLAGLTFMHIIQPWHILVLVFFSGIANAFDAPARQAIVWDLVERKHLQNAIALNAIMFTLSLVVGPALAGIAYALFGPAWCFLINGLSYMAIIVGLSLMRFKVRAKVMVKKSVFKDLKEGILYVISHPRIRVIFMLMGVIILFGMSFLTIFPAWAVTVLHGDATTNGILQASRGIGALLISALIASRGNYKKRGKMITIASFILSFVLLGFTFVKWPLLSYLIVGLFGASHLIITNYSNVLIQTTVKNEFRGRVLSFYSFLFFGLMPIGSLWIGFASEHAGLVFAVFAASLLTLASIILLWKFSPLIKLD